jgi:hypothetical protein
MGNERAELHATQGIKFSFRNEEEKFREIDTIDTCLQILENSHAIC